MHRVLLLHLLYADKSFRPRVPSSLYREPEFLLQPRPHGRGFVVVPDMGCLAARMGCGLEVVGLDGSLTSPLASPADRKLAGGGRK